ncbi:MAG: alpha/beta hydrolase [Deltaproteobacteria bacterium]|nr:alpha/beta hydrolase [Deltaproteobacteria bacterium]
MKTPVQQKYYKTFDGTKIGYQVIGTGKTPFILCNGLGGSSVGWSPIYNKLGRKFKFITWDYRGLFTSDKPKDMNRLSVEDHCRDLQWLLKKEKISKAIFGGWSMGVQVCLDYYRKNAKQYRGIFLINGTYGYVLETALNSKLTRHIVPAVNQLLIKALPRIQPTLQPLASYVINSRDFINIVEKLGMIHKNLDSEIFKEVAHAMMQTDLSTYVKLLDRLSEHSAADVLEKIKVPTLIVSATRDVMTPSWVAEDMAKKIPGAELLIVNNGSHYSLLEFPEIIVTRLEQFLKEYF